MVLGGWPLGNVPFCLPTGGWLVCFHAIRVRTGSLRGGSAGGSVGTESFLKGTEIRLEHFGAASEGTESLPQGTGIVAKGSSPLSKVPTRGSKGTESVSKGTAIILVNAGLAGLIF